MNTNQLALLAGLCLSVVPRLATAADGDPLAGLRKEHPRITFLKTDEDRVRKLIATDPLAKAWHEQLRAEATKMLTAEPVKYVLIGPRLLDKSRTAFDRVSLLAGLYRLDGDKAFAERARRELLDVAAFADWHPPHFLDTAEMTNAAGIGYDWLYDYLSPDDRKTIRDAIVSKGLDAGMAVYDSGKGWPLVKHNWNQVCNGGLTVGALAIADEEPQVAGKILRHSLASIPLALASYAPDGGWEEGPGYWGYATTFTVYDLAALDSALGTDFGLSDSPGLAEAGFFRIQTMGPTDLTFNFADAHPPAGTAPAMFWLANRYKQPAFAANERRLAKTHPGIFDLIWYTPEGTSADGAAADGATLPKDVLFKRVNVACFRGAWDDRNATYVGFKGGDNRANHSHLDLGTFVMDAGGRRWAADLGSDDYNLPGYFGKQRFTYYHLKTEGHNTLTIDGQNQATDAQAPITAFRAGDDRAYAIADLSEGYKASAQSVRRGIALLEDKRVLVEDEVRAATPVDVVWNFHTASGIDVSESLATLKQGEATLTARILSPEGARFEVLPSSGPKPEHQDEGMHNLVVRLPGKVTQTRIAVLLTPGGAEGDVPKVEGLERWVP